jgi:hypothetical protein
MAEQAVGRPLEHAVSSPRYLDVALLGRRLKTVAGSAVSLPVTTVLHVLNVPAKGDVRKLSRQIATLTNEVRQLASEVEELRRPMPKRQPIPKGSTPKRPSNPKRPPTPKQPSDA